MTVTLGILALLEAKPGQGGELAEFLKEARELAVVEEGTASWYAFKISDTIYGIFDTFATDGARIAHINGQIAAALVVCRPTCWQVTRTSGPSTSWRSSNQPPGDLIGTARRAGPGRAKTPGRSEHRNL